jgi:hypothetical protein
MKTGKSPAEGCRVQTAAKRMVSPLDEDGPSRQKREMIDHLTKLSVFAAVVVRLVTVAKWVDSDVHPVPCRDGFAGP